MGGIHNAVCVFIGLNSVSWPTNTHFSIGAVFFKLFTNKVCQQGVIQKTAKTLEACKARCAAVAACAYLAWDQSSKEECVHYSDDTCQMTGLSGGENQMFKKFGSIQVKAKVKFKVAPGLKAKFKLRLGLWLGSRSRLSLSLELLDHAIRSRF